MVYKLNFDGATKGNPGAAGYGGVCRNSAGKILQVFYGSIGFNANNSVTLKGMLQGLNLMLREGWISTMVEGDSNILIQMEK